MADICPVCDKKIGFFREEPQMGIFTHFDCRESFLEDPEKYGGTVKTEAPVSIRYKTKKGRQMIVGSGKIDLYVMKAGKYSVIELKAVSRILKENSKKTKEDTKEYHQLKKYLEALDVETGVLINFPFPPENEPEIIV